MDIAEGGDIKLQKSEEKMRKFAEIFFRFKFCYILGEKVPRLGGA